VENQSGKTALLRVIANGQVEGFPLPLKMCSVFVEADIVGERSHLNVPDYVFADGNIRNYGFPGMRRCSVQSMSYCSLLRFPTCLACDFEPESGNV
jgi:hypothetical protein